jgi:hypothetical protein
VGSALGLERDEFRAENKAKRRVGNQRAGDIDRETFVMVQSMKLRQGVDMIFRLENGAPAKPRPAKKP